ncbi:MAG: hypothetical protein WCF92_01590 [bacterium]
MSRKSTYVIFSIILIFLISIFVFFFFLYQKNSAGQYNLKGNLSNSIRDFLPFGKIAPLQTIPQTQNQQVTTQTNEATTSSFAVVIPVLRQISTAPIAGSTIVNSTSTIIQDKIKIVKVDQSIRFVDRSTGHIFETNKNSLNVTELSNTTIPKVYEAFFSSNPNVAIFRFLSGSSDTIISQQAYLFNPASSTVATTTKKITSSSTPEATSTVLTTPYTGTTYITKKAILPNDLESVALSPTSQKLVYLFENENGGTFVLSNTDGSKPIKLYSSALEQWLIDWPNENGVVITTKPSGVANGISLLINTKTGALSKVASGNGLTTLVSPDLTEALVGASKEGSSLQFAALTKLNKLVNLSLKTLPEKCVWSHTEKSTVYCAVPENIPQGTYPDNWYQGLVSFTDNLWKINISTGVSKVVSLFNRGYRKNFDVINLQLSSDDSYLTFENKNDLILWGYRLKNPDTTSSTATSTSTTTKSL